MPKFPTLIGLFAALFALLWAAPHPSAAAPHHNTRSAPLQAMLASAAQISVGGNHTCMIDDGGRVFCWGDNAYGQLGIGAFGGLRTNPVLVSGLGSNVKAIAAGNYHTCAILFDDTLRCWGRNSVGQLGNGNNPNRNLPVQVLNPSGGAPLTNVTSIAAGSTHTCAVNGGGVSCWGQNDRGQLGNNSISNSFLPVDVLNIAGNATLTNVAAVTVGSRHSCALLSTFTVACWGDNAFGQLGDGTSGNNSTLPVMVRVSLGGANLANVTQITAGGSHTCAMLSSPLGPKCWGSNLSGQLGINSIDINRNSPVDVNGLVGANGVIAAGGSTTCFAALSSNFTILCWGFNGTGNLGIGTLGGTSLTPVNVLTTFGGPALVGVSNQIAVGADHTCVRLFNANLKCWGSNNSGQLGIGNTNTPFASPFNVRVIAGQVVGGASFACGLLVGGSVKCWGNNNNGQMGNGTSGGTQPTPDYVLSSTGFSPFGFGAQLAAGTNHACAVLTLTIVNCWGLNANGQLGDNTTTPRPTPITVLSAAGGPTLSNVIAIAAGASHTCALLANTTVRCWGLNGNGQLGDGTTSQRLLPVAVLSAPASAPLDGVKAITAGGNHTCALMFNDTIKCWGQNTNGQLGDNSTSQRTTPVDVLSAPASAALGGVYSVVAGEAHTCALLNIGGVRCWGLNTNGQLGDDTVSQRLTPVSVLTGPASPVLGSINNLGAGNNHTCAVTVFQTVLCWGQNNFGQVGDNSSGNNRLTPAGVLTPSANPPPPNIVLEKVISVTGGSQFSCGVLTTNAVYCWGRNNTGQLGIGSTPPNQSNVAVPVISLYHFAFLPLLTR